MTLHKTPLHGFLTRHWSQRARNMYAHHSFIVLHLLLLSPAVLALRTTPSLPLSTSSRWIVDAGGRRVKLACVNWAAHLEAVVAEGLSRQPLDAISKRVAAMGFNCVRLTWPLYLITHASLASLTVRDSLLGLGLIESAAAVGVNNPALLDLTLLQAFQTVVTNLASNDIMVILDNQISKPGWCCSKLDGNGFFGDKYFDPDEWLEGLTQMARLFGNSSYVVGMSLRNELRGPRQNVSEWYRYMQRGAEAVHTANPNVLVILSGLDYDKDLSFLTEKQVKLSFQNKLVFEMHWYGFSDGQDWANGNPNEVCGFAVRNFTSKGGFLLKQGWPLFLSEFGVDQGGSNVADNCFLSCFLSLAADVDFDWALWALQGSYYLREGQLGFDETYGVLGWDWCKARNSSFIQRISAVQSPLQGPGISNGLPHKIIFHPFTSLCVLQKSLPEQLVLGPCVESQGWSYTEDKRIVLEGSELCLKVGGISNPAKLGTGCSGSNAKWELMSESKMHVASNMGNNSVCLDIALDGTVVTNLCNCLNQDGKSHPEKQWFKIVSRNRDITSKSSHLK